MSTMTPAQEAVITSLTTSVTQFLGTQLDGQFAMINYPAGFPFQVQYGPNNYYNQASLQVIDALASVGTNGIETMSTAAPSSTLYYNFMQDVVYQISKADQQMIQNTTATLAGLQSTVITEFETDFGTISTAEITASKCFPATKIGYIQSIVLSIYGNNPSTIPTSAADFAASYQLWMNQAAQMLTVCNRATVAQLQLTAAIAAVKTPTAANGGLQVSSASYYAGYSGMPATAAIVASLQTASRQVSLSCSVSNMQSDQSSFNVSGGTAFSIPLDFITVNIDASAEYDINKVSGSASSMTLSLSYPGITVLSAQPVPLTPDDIQGWFAQNILQQVVANTGKDVTGFQLTGSEFNVATLFGANGQFSRAKTLVLSQEPTITFTFQNSTYSQVQSYFHEQASVEVSLFGLFSLGSAQESYTVQSVTQDSAGVSVTVTLTPPNPASVPAQQQTCNVLGGVISTPPDSLLAARRAATARGLAALHSNRSVAPIANGHSAHSAPSMTTHRAD